MMSFNLERPARELTESIAKGPPLSGVSLAEARKAVEAAQSAPPSMPGVDESIRHRVADKKGLPTMANASRANHRNPAMPLPAAIVGVVTSFRTSTADRDVPRESKEEK
jgi:hypothetical protein